MYNKSTMHFLANLQLCRLAALVVLVGGSPIHVRADMNGHKQHNLTNVADKMDILCPYNTICRTGKPVLQLDGTKESCCGDCSCEETCGLTLNCCYPEQDLYGIVDRSIQQCTPASTYQSTSSSYPRRDYYMVVDDNGLECDNGCLPFSDDDGATLGRLYPVSSKSTGTIYINEQCARCHGVNTTDQLPWEAVLVCKPTYSDEYVETWLQILETGKLHPVCHLDFYYPGPSSDVSNRRCYDGTVHTCQSISGLPYDIPAELNMTEAEVRAACLSDLRVHYLNRYFNIFCYICNDGPSYPTRQCVQTLESRGATAKSLKSAFSSILDPSIFQRKANTVPALKEPILTACKLRAGTKINSDDCRKLLCPAGQLRIGRSCVYQDVKVLDSDVDVVAKLYPQSRIRTETIESYQDANRYWEPKISNKGIRKWTLKGLLYESKPCGDTDECIKYFWIKLRFRATNDGTNMQTIIKNVGKFMTDEWSILINDSKVPLKPKFSDFTRVAYSPKDNLYRPQHYLLLNVDEMPAFLENINSSSLMAIIEDTSLKIYSLISKMFFCEQVSLRKGEYHLDSLFRFLYLNESDRHIFPGEFTLGYDIDGGVVPRLCLEDAGFALLPGQTGASPQPLPPNACTLVIVLMLVRTMGNMFQ